MRVAVLGCGPAGLLAAYGATMAGAKVDIFSIKKKSPMPGAQFMHREIPGLGIKRDEVKIYKRGTREGYAKKVHGSPDHPSSWDLYTNQTLECWSMSATYDELWYKFEDRILDVVIDPEVLDSIEESPAEYNRMISSIPAYTLCSEGHTFLSEEHRISVYSRTGIEQNYIIYNGILGDEWHRSSVLQGTGFLEYGPGRAAPDNAMRVLKPQSNDCDCRALWQRVGRYGQWKRGILAHTAYEEAYLAVHPM